MRHQDQQGETHFLLVVSLMFSGCWVTMETSITVMEVRDQQREPHVTHSPVDFMLNVVLLCVHVTALLGPAALIQSSC